jgi:aryl-alcohol dehydrogenase-like predicted oxidoreductase
MSETNTARIRKLKTMAEQLDVSAAQLTLAWTMAQPDVTSVITGATRLEQLLENLGSLTLDPSQTQALNELFPAT